MGNKNLSLPTKKEDIISFQQQKCICKIYMYFKGILCGLSNGFFCLVPFPDINHLIPVLFTTYRTINEKYIKENKEIEITLNNDKYKKKIQLDNTRKMYLNKEYDIVIIEIQPERDKIHDFLNLDESLQKPNLCDIYNQAKIYLICYGKENKMDMYEGTIKEIEGQKIHHISQTESGSGGCPILSPNNFKVIGIHLGRTPHEYKKGILLDIPLKEFMAGNKFFKIE